jgi:Fe-S-cluster containining protein
MPEKTKKLTQKEALSKIYGLYDDYIESFSFACKKLCSECCTNAMTLTSLEGRLIADFLDKEKKQAFYKQLHDNISTPRYQPSLTTNGYAWHCLQQRPMPREVMPDDPGVCLLLENNLCSIYPVRPFGCRCMLSTTACTHGGSARIDELTLTVSTVFLQYIEHLDQSGFFGSLIDVMLRLEPGNCKNENSCVTAANRPAAQLMVPPEHREKIQPLIDSLNHILSRVKHP